MTFSFPFRTGLLRRVVTAYRNAVPALMITLPALTGTILLLITVPSILAFLNTETRLIGGYTTGALDVQADCNDLRFDVVVLPYPSEFDAGSDSARAPSVKLSFYRRQAQGPPGMDDEGQLPARTQSFRERFGPANCKSAVVTVKSPGPSTPRLVAQAFSDEQIDELSEGKWRIALKDANHRQSLTFDWPDLYAYSQAGYGWINSQLDDFASGTSFLVTWNAESDMASTLSDRSTLERMDLHDAYLVLFAPPGFNVDYARELDIGQNGQTRQAQSSVEYSMRALDTGWGNAAQPLRVITGAAIFKTEDFDAKQNFTLLVGGAMLGLGIALIVESLIAVLFKVERRIKRRKEKL